MNLSEQWKSGGEHNIKKTGFRQEHLARREGGLGEHHAGELRREAAEAKGEWPVDTAGWNEFLPAWDGGWGAFGKGD
jgi:hypothetical protein